jgi:hypothetical protein
MNVIETLLYLVYAFLVGAYGKGGGLVGARTVEGRAGGLAALLVFTASVMTLSKTVLYCELLLNFWG